MSADSTRTMKLCCLLVSVLVVQVNAQCPVLCKCSRYLQHINCASASLTDVPNITKTFRITILDLSENKITQLTDGIFEERNLTKVYLVDFSSNNITAVESGAFRGISSTNLVSLEFRNNIHIKLPEQGFQLETLMHLDLSFCNLKKIPATFFQGMPNIIYLSLNGNSLTFFDPSIIEPGKGLNLDHLYLNDNKFTTLDMKLAMYQKAELWIDGNPFHCDCAFKMACTVLAERQLSSPGPLRCQTPAYLEGVTSEHLLKMSFKCEDMELVPSLDDRSWWFLHQWWILTVCALAVVVVAVLVLVFQNRNSLSGLERICSSLKFLSSQNLSKSEINLVD